MESTPVRQAGTKRKALNLSYSSFPKSSKVASGVEGLVRSIPPAKARAPQATAPCASSHPAASIAYVVQGKLECGSDTFGLVNIVEMNLPGSDGIDYWDFSWIPGYNIPFVSLSFVALLAALTLVGAG